MIQTCPVCNGTREVEVERTEGTVTMAECGACDGEVCCVCDGTGHVDEAYRCVLCDSCSGTGRVGGSAMPTEVSENVYECSCTDETLCSLHARCPWCDKTMSESDHRGCAAIARAEFMTDDEMEEARRLK